MLEIYDTHILNARMAATYQKIRDEEDNRFWKDGWADDGELLIISRTEMDSESVKIE